MADREVEKDKATESSVQALTEMEGSGVVDLGATEPVPAVDAESSSSSSGIDIDSSQRDTVEGATSSPTDAEHQPTTPGQISSPGTSDAQSKSSSAPEVLSESSASDAGQPINSADQKNCGSSPDAETESEQSPDIGVSSESQSPEVQTEPSLQDCVQSISTAEQMSGSSPDAVSDSCPDAGVKHESPFGGEEQPDSTDIEHDIPSTGTQSESSPDAGVKSESPSDPDEQPESSTDVEHDIPSTGTQSESSPDAGVNLPDPESSGSELPAESSPANVDQQIISAEQGASESSTDTGLQSESSRPESSLADAEQITQETSRTSLDIGVQSESSSPEVKPESSLADRKQQITSNGEKTPGLPTDAAVQAESSGSEVQAHSSPISTSEGISSSTDGRLNMAETASAKNSQAGSSGPEVKRVEYAKQQTPAGISYAGSSEGRRVFPANSNTLLKAMLSENTSRSDASDSRSEGAQLFPFTEEERMTGEAGNQRNSHTDTRRPFSSLPRSTGTEIRGDEDDQMVPDMGHAVRRSLDPRSQYPYPHDETTSDSQVSEQFNANEPHSPEVRSTEDSTDEMQELDSEIEDSVLTGMPDGGIKVQSPSGKVSIIRQNSEGYVTTSISHPAVQTTAPVAPNAQVPLADSKGTSEEAVTTPTSVIDRPAAESASTVQTPAESASTVQTPAESGSTVQTPSESGSGVRTPAARMSTIRTLAASMSTVRTPAASVSTVRTPRTSASVAQVPSEETELVFARNVSDAVVPTMDADSEPDEIVSAIDSVGLPSSDSEEAFLERTIVTDLLSADNVPADEVPCVDTDETTSEEIAVSDTPADSGSEDQLQFADSEETVYRGKAMKRHATQIDEGSSGSGDSDNPCPAKKMAGDTSDRAASVPTAEAPAADPEETLSRAKAPKRPISVPSDDSQDNDLSCPPKKVAETTEDVPKPPEGQN